MNQKSQNQSHNNAKPGPRGLTVDVILYIETTNHTAHNTSACQLQQDGMLTRGLPNTPIRLHLYVTLLEAFEKPWCYLVLQNSSIATHEYQTLINN